MKIPKIYEQNTKELKIYALVKIFYALLWLTKFSKFYISSLIDFFDTDNNSMREKKRIREKSKMKVMLQSSIAILEVI